MAAGGYTKYTEIAREISAAHPGLPEAERERQALQQWGAQVREFTPQIIDSLLTELAVAPLPVSAKKRRRRWADQLWCRGAALGRGDVF